MRSVLSHDEDTCETLLPQGSVIPTEDRVETL